MDIELYEFELDKLEKDIRRMGSTTDEKELFHSWVFAMKRIDRICQHNYGRIQDGRSLNAPKGVPG